MRASRSFLALLRDNPQESHIASHRWMLRSGMIQQVASGIYAWLPLGLRVLNKISAIVRQEQDRIGAQEALAPTLQPASLWKQSGRYADYGKEMLRMTDRHDNALLYGPTAEEVFTLLFRTHIHSYKQLPQCLYNIQWKFRDEIRPRFGVMRGREFLMKDAYSFDLTADGAKAAYASMFQAYMRTFRRLGVSAIPVRASTGPIGGDLSHEFHIVAATGESEIFYDIQLDSPASNGCMREAMADFQGFYAMADDRHDPATCPLPPEQQRTARGIEVGHIFYFGTKYSEPLDAFVMNGDGVRIPVEMGSYGIGVSRLAGALIEAHHDEKGIQWPLSVAPYAVVVAGLGAGTGPVAEKLYETLQSHGIETFLFDLDQSAGKKFADMDMMGFPYQILVGSKWRSEEMVDIKIRATGQLISCPIPEATAWIMEHCACVQNPFLARQYLTEQG
jgi:prolyl-tRNA synthetase